MLKDSDPAGALPCLLHHLRTSSMNRCHFPPLWGQILAMGAADIPADSGWKDAASINWTRDRGVSPWGGQSMALGLQGQEQTTLEPSQLALGVPQASCALLLMRCKSLFLQGRDQGRWKWSCSSVLSSMEMPTVSHGVCPDGAEPCLGTSRVVMSDGEASINAEGPFPSPTLGCLQTLFPSPPQHGRKRLCFGAGKELPRS